MSAATENQLPDFRLRIAGMDCGDCALTIEKSLNKLDGIRNVRVNFTTETLEASGDITEEEIAQRIADLGYRVALEEETVQRPVVEARGVVGFFRYLMASWHTAFALIAAVVLTATIPWVVAETPGTDWLSYLYLTAVLVIGAPVVLKGLRSLIYARRMTIDLLMGVAALGAVLIGATGEAAAVVVLFTIGEALEGYSAEQSRRSLRGLMSLQPDVATVLRAHRDDHGHDHGAQETCAEHEHQHDTQPDSEHLDQDVHYHRVTVPVSELEVGDVVFVRPGERIPVDGAITSGISSINQAAITGESTPVRGETGTRVYAGSINGEGALEIRMERPAQDSTISRVARLVEQAQAQRSPAERFIDRFAQWYTPTVVGLALGLVLIAVLAFGQPLLDTADGTRGWMYRGLALLIIACPCALVISIPVTVVSGLTRLAQLGVLVKGGAQLEALNQVSVFAFDKTGTLTTGQPRVTGSATVDCVDGTLHDADCESCDELVAVASAVETGSEHPVAHAVVARAEDRAVKGRYQPAQDVTALAGRGVTGNLAEETVTIGSPHLFREPENDDKPVPDWIPSSGQDGQSVIIVARDKDVVGYLTVADRPRESSHNALKALRQARPQARMIMLTGDDSGVARRIHEDIPELDEVRGNLMPEDKLNAVRELETSGGVAMVGDGINDAPALAAARVGIAMGGAGTAQAMETADVVLMQDNMSHLPLAVRMASKTKSLLRQNVALSLGLKLAFLALAVPGLATMWMAVLADVGATLLVTLNGMRLLRLKESA